MVARDALTVFSYISYIKIYVLGDFCKPCRLSLLVPPLFSHVCLFHSLLNTRCSRRESLKGLHLNSTNHIGVSFTPYSV